LSSDFPAAVLVVMHTSPESPGMLAPILDRVGPLRAASPVDGEPIKPGRIYVAPPDYHMIVEDNTLRLTHGPRENNFRPAVDPLFRSAAVARGSHVIGVILSGGLDDGTYGLSRIKELGGVAVVQDPLEALVTGMPASALRNLEVDHVLPVAEIAPLLNQLAHESFSRRRSAGGPKAKETAVGRGKTGERRGRNADADRREGEGAAGHEGRPVAARQAEGGAERIALEEAAQADPSKLLEQHPVVGEPTVLTCPECGGLVSETRAGNTSHFLCHVGHAYSESSLEAAKLNGVEAALWTAVRVLKESASMYDLMARRARERHRPATAERFQKRLNEARQRAEIILGVLVKDQEKPVPRPVAGERRPARAKKGAGR
jgi:two-component system chemotaxis response regulator CheB